MKRLSAPGLILAVLVLGACSGRLEIPFGEESVTDVAATPFSEVYLKTANGQTSDPDAPVLVDAAACPLCVRADLGTETAQGYLIK